MLLHGVSFFLKRMNSRQEIVKKKQDTIFEISICYLNYLEVIMLRLAFASNRPNTSGNPID